MNKNLFNSVLGLVSTNHSFEFVSNQWDIIENGSNFNKLSVINIPCVWQVFELKGIQKGPFFRDLVKKHVDGLAYLYSGSIEKFLAIEMKDNILNHLETAKKQIAASLCSMKLLEYMGLGTKSNIECIGFVIGTTTPKYNAYIVSNINSARIANKKLTLSQSLYNNKEVRTTIGALDSNIPQHLASISVLLRLKLLNEGDTHCILQLSEIL